MLRARGVGVLGRHRSDPLGFSLGIERVNSDCRYITNHPNRSRISDRAQCRWEDVNSQRLES